MWISFFFFWKACASYHCTYSIVSKHQMCCYAVDVVLRTRTLYEYHLVNVFLNLHFVSIRWHSNKIQISNAKNANFARFTAFSITVLLYLDCTFTTLQYSNTNTHSRPIFLGGVCKQFDSIFFCYHHLSPSFDKMYIKREQQNCISKYTNEPN